MISVEMQKQKQQLDASRREDRQRWSDLYHLWYGRHGIVMSDFFARHYGSANDSGDLVQRHTRLLRWAAVNTAPSSTWEPEVSGPQEAVDVVTSSVKAIQTTLAISELAGMLWLELRTKKGKPYLRATWGHSFNADLPYIVDPASPESLADCLEINIDTPTGTISYRRSVSGGPVTAYMDGAPVPGYPVLPIMPVLGIYRDGEVDAPLPGMDDTWLSSQKGLTESVTDAAFHARTLPGFTYVEGLTKDDLQAGEIVIGPNKVVPVPDGARIGRQNPPSGAIREMLSTSIDTVRLTAVLANLPPDLVEQMGRSETGAARTVDMGALYRTETRDWSRAVKVYRQIQGFLVVLLPAFGVPVDGLAIMLPKPIQPETGDPLHIEQARELRRKNGVTSIIDELARFYGFGREEAIEKYRQIVADNEAYPWEVPNGNQSEAPAAPKDADVDGSDSGEGDPMG